MLDTAGLAIACRAADSRRSVERLVELVQLLLGGTKHARERLLALFRDLVELFRELIELVALLRWLLIRPLA